MSWFHKVKKKINCFIVATWLGLNLNLNNRRVCPIHEGASNATSFCISDDGQVYYCHSCQASGDAIDLAIKCGLTYEDIAKKTGIPLNQPFCPRNQILQEVKNYWHECLLNNEEQLQYLEKRGISTDTIKRLQIGFADTDKNKLINHHFHLFCYNHAAKNPYYQWFINHILYPGGPVQVLKSKRDAPLRLLELALWWDPALPEKKPADLPIDRCLVPGQSQYVYFRSGFKGKGDTIVKFNFNDSFNGDGRNGQDFGSFFIYKDEFLANRTFKGNNQGDQFGKNNIAFWDTSTRKKNGMDHPVWPDFYCDWGTQTQLIRAYLRSITGTIKAFETREEFAYLGFMDEGHYFGKAQGVKEWNCQAVFLKPGVLIRFDRTETSKPNHQPRFHFQITGEQLKVNGKVINSIIYDHVEDYDADEISYLGHLHRSKMHMKILLPKDRHIRIAMGNLANQPPKLISRTYSAHLLPRNFKLSGEPIILNFLHHSKSGLKKQILPALRFRPANQKVAGTFRLKIKGNKMMITQAMAELSRKYMLPNYPTLKHLSDMMEMDGFYTEVAANYEQWREWKKPMTCRYHIRNRPFHNTDGSMPDAKRKAILTGDKRSRRDILYPKQSGALEVRLNNPNADPRQYFLNVFTATNAAETDPAIPQSTLEETPDSYTVVVHWPKEEYRITFNKKGAIKGKIEIRKKGQKTKTHIFTNRIVTENQPFGSDFLTGRLGSKY